MEKSNYHEDHFNVESRMSERDIKKYEGPYTEQRLQEILSDVASGSNQIVFYHDKGIKEIAPLNVNTVQIKDGSLHIFFTQYPDDPNEQITIPLSNLELVTQYQ